MGATTNRPTVTVGRNWVALVWPSLKYTGVTTDATAEPIKQQTAVAKAMPATLSPLNARSSERPPGSSTADASPMTASDAANPTAEPMRPSVAMAA